MNTKRAFVPTAGQLEDRVALSGFNASGQAILTTRELRSAFQNIQRAFVRYGSDGLNANRLASDLANAVSVIPYNMRDGLVQTMRNDAQLARSNVITGVNRPLLNAMWKAQTDVQLFVNQQGARGLLVVR